MMYGPAWTTHSPRGSFIETQTFVENIVDFKLGAIFPANQAVSLECHDKLTDKPRYSVRGLKT